MDTFEKKDTATQKFLELNGRKIILVGTAHVSAESIKEVESAIEENKPDVVAIELDDKRLSNIEDPESWRKMDIVKVLKNHQGFLMMANIVLASYQKRMGESSGVKPGDEMLAAINKSKELGIPQEMVDRPIAVTLRRAWAKNSFWGKCKLLSSLIVSAFSKEEVAPGDIENLKQQSEMDSMMQELSDYLPKVKEVLIDERDRYLASHIWECKGNNVLAVLGAGHLPGVVAYLTRLASGEVTSNCDDISEVPPKTIGSRIAGWVIPVIIVALIVMGFVFGGKDVGVDMLATWLICNGGLAGIGAIIAGAHPVVILASVICSPFTSLVPVIGVGMITGILQAVLRKPKVEDLETLSDDAKSFKYFYKNRVLHVLWVFILTSLGSSLGAFAAGASIVVAVKSFFVKIIALFAK